MTSVIDLCTHGYRDTQCKHMIYLLVKCLLFCITELIHQYYTKLYRQDYQVYNDLDEISNHWPRGLPYLIASCPVLCHPILSVSPLVFFLLLCIIYLNWFNSLDNLIYLVWSESLSTNGRPLGKSTRHRGIKIPRKFITGHSFIFFYFLQLGWKHYGNWACLKRK